MRADDGVGLLAVQFLEMIESLGEIPDPLRCRAQGASELVERATRNKRAKNVPSLRGFVPIEAEDLPLQR